MVDLEVRTHLNLHPHYPHPVKHLSGRWLQRSYMSTPYYLSTVMVIDNYTLHDDLDNYIKFRFMKSFLQWIIKTVNYLNVAFFEAAMIGAFVMSTSSKCNPPLKASCCSQSDTFSCDSDEKLVAFIWQLAFHLHLKKKLKEVYFASCFICFSLTW